MVSIRVKRRGLYGVAVLGFATLLIPFSAPAASVTLNSYSATISPAPTSDTIGSLGVFSLGSLNNGSGTPTATVSGLYAFNIGNFQTSGSNSNVTSTFALNVGITLKQGSTTITDTFSFSGSVTSSGNNYELTYIKPSSTTGVYGSYTYASYPFVPPGPQLFETETLNFAGIGNYTFGIANDYLVNTGSGKTTTLYAFLAPQGATVPEPLSAGLTGFVLLGLIGFATRQKFRSKRG